MGPLDDFILLFNDSGNGLLQLNFRSLLMGISLFRKERTPSVREMHIPLLKIYRVYHAASFPRARP